MKTYQIQWDPALPERVPADDPIPAWPALLERGSVQFGYDRASTPFVSGVVDVHRIRWTYTEGAITTSGELPRGEAWWWSHPTPEGTDEVDEFMSALLERVVDAMDQVTALAVKAVRSDILALIDGVCECGDEA